MLRRCLVMKSNACVNDNALDRSVDAAVNGIDITNGCLCCTNGLSRTAVIKAALF